MRRIKWNASVLLFTVACGGRAVDDRGDQNTGSEGTGGVEAGAVAIDDDPPEGSGGSSGGTSKPKPPSEPVGTCNPAYCPSFVDSSGTTGAGCCVGPNGPCGVDVGYGCGVPAPTVPGTCNPSFCPVPQVGVACCASPNGPCGTDTGDGCVSAVTCLEATVSCPPEALGICQCICEVCPHAQACVADEGCVRIALCADEKSCLGEPCLSPEVCGDVIAEAGPESYTLFHGLEKCGAVGSCIYLPLK